MNKSIDLSMRKKITLDDYEIITKIGTGSYADVMLARDKLTN